MSENEGLIVRPDGMSSNAEQYTVRLYEVEVPLPSGKSQDLLKLCMRVVNVPHPLTGIPIPQHSLAMSADTALVLLETDLALKVRDERIAALEERLSELERRLDDPAEQAKREGYDGIE